MGKLVRIIYFLFALIFLGYLSLPNFEFPKPPPDSLQSNEPADTETSLRRAYFTNYTREEVIEHYLKQMKRSPISNIPLPTYRLNYPPEEAQTIIRDQTRSTFLEEIVHPLRESVFVNGFEPKESKDTIFIDGRLWRQKIIIRYIPSNLFVRIVIGVLILILTPIIFRSGEQNLKTFVDRLKGDYA